MSSPVAACWGVDVPYRFAAGWMYDGRPLIDVIDVNLSG
jgi:hypothetical protein